MNSLKTRSIQPENPVRSIIIIGALFFIFGFITWLNAVLIPYLKLACELSNFDSYLVAFAFYIAYFVMAVPSGWVLKKTGFKKGMSIGLFIMALGAVIFIPAAVSREYALFLLGLFILGSGLALLQTASNPYVTVLGPIESAAKRISIMGLCNKLAGALAPVILGAIVLKDADTLSANLASMDLATKNMQLDLLASRVIFPYVIIAVLLLLLGVFLYFSGLPEINTEQEDEHLAQQNSGKTSVFQFPHLVLGVITLFFYIGAEVIAGDTIISYGNYYDIPFSTAKYFTTYTLVFMIVGYLIGIALIPRYLTQEKALKYCALSGIVFTLLALSNHGFISVFFIALLGLSNSLMWPALWPLALKGLGRFTKIASSLLIMGLIGGALLPMVYGKLADDSSPQKAYWMLVPCYLFIFYYAAAGHKVRSFGKYKKEVAPQTEKI